MNIHFTPDEARVIGVLLEKELTTPDQYPLSLHALVTGCNQKSNREPVMNLAEATVQATVDALKKRYLVADHSGYGSRVTKYRHRLCNTEIGGLQIAPLELAILCELLLRGPQTAGQLRIHVERLHAVPDVAAVESAVQHLMDLDEPLVRTLPKGPGQREIRFTHRFGPEDSDFEAIEPIRESVSTDDARWARLEQDVEVLRLEVARLRQLVEGDG